MSRLVVLASYLVRIVIKPSRSSDSVLLKASVPLKKQRVTLLSTVV